MKRYLTVSALLVFILTLGLAGTAFGKNADYVNQNLLISPAEAKELIDSTANVAVVDVRNPGQYDDGHIPGAVNVWRPDYGASSGEYEFRGMRGTPQKIHQMLGEKGISGNSKLIVYSHGNCHDAYRFTWLITMAGHDMNNIRIIDGKFPAWKAAGFPVSTEAPQIRPVNYNPQNSIDESRLAKMEDIEKAIDDPDTIILDTRTTLEYIGIAQYDGAFRKGRIPDSVHINFTENFTDQGVKSADELKAIYEKAGITPDKTIISYCQSGVRSAMTTVILGELLGYPNVKNYDGSWIEWSYNRDKSVEATFLLIVSIIMILLIAGTGFLFYTKGKKGEKSNANKVAIVLAILFAVFLMWYYNLFKLISMDGVGQMQAWIESFGIFGPLVFILLFIAACIFFLPGAPFGIVAGIVFGPIMGTLWAIIGGTLGASVAFLLGRYAFRGFAEKLIEKNPKLKKIDDGVNQHGWRMLMITRFVPIFPFNVQNYVYGLTKIPFVTYAGLSFLFMLPGTAAYVFIAGAAVSGANMTTIMMYFAIGAILLVALSFVPKILKKKSNAADLLDE